ncbi:MAG: anthranilate synthase component I family protein, partial [Ferruginibacter sp.]
MKQIKFSTGYQQILADVYTPVGIYLRLRDRFRDTILLESTDFHASENSYSIIAVNAIAGIEIRNKEQGEYKLPGRNTEKVDLNSTTSLLQQMQYFMNCFEVDGTVPSPVNIAQGIFGYSSYDAVQLFENIKFDEKKLAPQELSIPLMRYRLYQYVIIFNHFKDQLFICENKFDGIESKLADLMSIIRSKDVPVFPFCIS